MYYFQDVLSNPMLNLQEARLREIIVWIYDDLGLWWTLI